MPVTAPAEDMQAPLSDVRLPSSRSSFSFPPSHSLPSSISSPLLHDMASLVVLVRTTAVDPQAHTGPGTRESLRPQGASPHTWLCAVA